MNLCVQFAASISLCVFEDDTSVFFIHLLSKDLLRACSVPSTFLVSGDTVVNKIIISSLAS